MPELSEVLERLGLLQYLGRLNDEGFDKWETVLDITEQDLAALNFKLGHRRILQREIASARGIAATQALTPAQFGPADDYDQEDKTLVKATRLEQVKAQSTTTGKRKYRRHPKTDENAPEKPPSAYVMFANSVRDELKGQNLSFTEIAQLVGARWKVLDPEKKEMYEYEASAAKDKFNTEFEEYKKTESYAQYAKYLSEFKAKLAKDGKENAEQQSDTSMKRQRLEYAPSTGSQAGSSVSAPGGSPISVGSVSGMGSASSPGAGSGKVGGVLLGAPSVYASPPSRKASTSPKQACTLPAMNTGPPPSPHKSAIDFAGYRDALARTTQQQQQEVQLATTVDTDSHFLPRIHAPVHSPHTQQQSYMRHQPTSAPTPPGGPPSRGSVVLPSPGLRRHEDGFSPLSSISGSISSSGSSTAPSITPTLSGLEETRSHRALPLPSPSTASGYFDQRSHHQRQPSQPQSPRSSYGQPQLPLPAIEHHSRAYSPTSLPLPPPPPLPGPGPSLEHSQHRPD